MWTTTSMAKPDIYVRQVIDVGTVIYDQYVMYGQKRHLWTAPRLRGKPSPGSARVPPWAVVSIAGIAMAQQNWLLHRTRICE
jgi:hypothetical protein